MIQQVVDDHTSHGDVQPQPVGQWSELYVQDKLALESSAQSYEDERHDHYCKQSVAGQQREVHGTAPAVSCEVQYSGVGVIVEVAEQKDHRG